MTNNSVKTDVEAWYRVRTVCEGSSVRVWRWRGRKNLAGEFEYMPYGGSYLDGGEADVPVRLVEGL